MKDCGEDKRRERIQDKKTINLVFTKILNKEANDFNDCYINKDQAINDCRFKVEVSFMTRLTSLVAFVCLIGLLRVDSSQPES